MHVLGTLPQGYICYDPVTRKRDVHFVESESFFQAHDESGSRSQGESLSDLVSLPTITNEEVATDIDA